MADIRSDKHSGVAGGNDKVPDSDIQGEQAGKASRDRDGERDTASSDREGRPSEYPASKAGIARSNT